MAVVSDEKTVPVKFAPRAFLSTSRDREPSGAMSVTVRSDRSLWMMPTSTLTLSKTKSSSNVTVFVTVWKSAMGMEPPAAVCVRSLPDFLFF